MARKEENAARAMRYATGTIRRGHNPKRPYRATAASRRYTTPAWRTGHPGAMASAAPAWPQAALQRLEALEPAPFPPQRLGLDLLEAPKPPTARPGIAAAACALPEAPLVGAEAERSQQIALRAPDQIAAHARWPRQPLFEREPPREASRVCRFAFHGLAPFSSSSPGGRRRVFPFSRCGFAPEFCPRQEKRSQKAEPKASPRISSLERREAERREAHHRAASRSDAARVLSPFPSC